MIPYDVQRLAHELWDDAELSDKSALNVEDVRRGTRRLVASQTQYYERLRERLASRQRAGLQALAESGAKPYIPSRCAVSMVLDPRLAQGTTQPPVD